MITVVMSLNSTSWKCTSALPWAITMAAETAVGLPMSLNVTPLKTMPDPPLASKTGA